MLTPNSPESRKTLAAKPSINNPTQLNKNQTTGKECGKVPPCHSRGVDVRSTPFNALWLYGAGALIALTFIAVTLVTPIHLTPLSEIGTHRAQPGCIGDECVLPSFQNPQPQSEDGDKLSGDTKTGRELKTAKKSSSRPALSQEEDEKNAIEKDTLREGDAFERRLESGFDAFNEMSLNGYSDMLAQSSGIGYVHNVGDDSYLDAITSREGGSDYDYDYEDERQRNVRRQTKLGGGVSEVGIGGQGQLSNREVRKQVKELSRGSETMVGVSADGYGRERARKSNRGDIEVGGGIQNGEMTARDGENRMVQSERRPTEVTPVNNFMEMSSTHVLNNVIEVEKPPLKEGPRNRAGGYAHPTDEPYEQHIEVLRANGELDPNDYELIGHGEGGLQHSFPVLSDQMKDILHGVGNGIVDGSAQVVTDPLDRHHSAQEHMTRSNLPDLLSSQHPRQAQVNPYLMDSSFNQPLSPDMMSSLGLRPTGQMAANLISSIISGVAGDGGGNSLTSLNPGGMLGGVSSTGDRQNRASETGRDGSRLANLASMTVNAANSFGLPIAQAQSFSQLAAGVGGGLLRGFGSLGGIPVGGVVGNADVGQVLSNRWQTIVNNFTPYMEESLRYALTCVGTSDWTHRNFIHDVVITSPNANIARGVAGALGVGSTSIGQASAASFQAFSNRKVFARVITSTKKPLNAIANMWLNRMVMVYEDGDEIKRGIPAEFEVRNSQVMTENRLEPRLFIEAASYFQLDSMTGSVTIPFDAELFYSTIRNDRQYDRNSKTPDRVKGAIQLRGVHVGPLVHHSMFDLALRKVCLRDILFFPINQKLVRVNDCQLTQLEQNGRRICTAKHLDAANYELCNQMEKNLCEDIINKLLLPYDGVPLPAPDQGHDHRRRGIGLGNRNANHGHHNSEPGMPIPGWWGDGVRAWINPRSQSCVSEKMFERLPQCSDARNVLSRTPLLFDPDDL